jgi:peptidoglycan/LPS O-acetylase OafA/YrhL
VKQRHLDYLDGWRGLAIAVLLIGHFFPYWRMSLGLAGVDLFFVLSGLLMARLLFIEQSAIVSFYRRRISRILPGFYFFVGAIVLCYLALGLAIDWQEVAGAALLIRNYFPAGTRNDVPFGHIWSLAVEEHSYVLLSLVALSARRRWLSAAPALGGFAVLFAGFGLAYSVLLPGPDLYSHLLIHSEVCAFGIFASGFLLLHFQTRGIPTLPLIVYPALALFGLATHLNAVPQELRLVLGVGAFALLVNLLPAAPSVVRAALSIRPLRQLGIWSFSIYLWQQPFYSLAGHGHMAEWAGCMLSIASGVLSFYLIENPARRYLNRGWAKERSPQGTVLISQPPQ